MAWIVERFRDWSSGHDVPEEAVSRDLMLANVMVYWLFGTAASAGRYYKESPARDEHDPVPVRAAVAVACHPTTSTARCAATPKRFCRSSAGPIFLPAANSPPWSSRS